MSEAAVRQLLADGRRRQRGTYLHEWTCECGQKCSSGREPKSLGRVVMTWCYGCRRTKAVSVPAELGGYLPAKQTVDMDHISNLRAEIARLQSALAEREKTLSVARRLIAQTINFVDDPLSRFGKETAAGTGSCCFGIDADEAAEIRAAHDSRRGEGESNG